MTTFDDQYQTLLEDIMRDGVSNEGKPVRTVWKDGIPAHTIALWGYFMRFTPEDGFPLLFRKYVNPRSFSSEILWIMQKTSNVVQVARDLGTNVWNEWEGAEGTIGRAYGYQVDNNRYHVRLSDISEQALQAIGKHITSIDQDYTSLNQMDYVIHQIIDNPYSRQTLTSLVNPQDTHKMALPPCVWTSHWEVMGDDKLHLSVHARSSDVFLGLPFNVSQYALLHRLIAHVTGREIGDFIFFIDDAHLYDRHIEQAKEFIEREKVEEPRFWLDETITSFQDFEYGTNFDWNGYTKHIHIPLPAPIAVGRDELERGS